MTPPLVWPRLRPIVSQSMQTGGGVTPPPPLRQMALTRIARRDNFLLLISLSSCELSGTEVVG